MDDEVGANSEHGRLQHQPQDLGDCAKASGGVARAPVARKIIRLTLLQRPMRCGTMPMATRASELRRLDSSMVLRDCASLAAVFVGLSTSHSVRMVRMTKMNAPIVAVMPIQKWKAKQIPR